ncbi:uncharacterized protein ColSpa_08330 [Colletotrichum spaethianum]|uniref:Uncharacterized protein n=1 Tax=Colletotrichum spaethianum TaxID=700344 RepID=A0AA37UIK2_9PEZI|nr:uncharacterized protein ColSpa_08330 [Colletotrichum spaethianum]GKT48149.1 hypothetical protein ColSpa_08330 [Colletotrichum spaethianum]
MADERDELVALVSRGSRLDLGTRFEFVNSAAYGDLGDQFSMVVLMSGIGVILAEKKSLGDCVDALEISTRRRPMLIRASLVEKEARDARDWLNTMDLLEDCQIHRDVTTWSSHCENTERPATPQHAQIIQIASSPVNVNAKCHSDLRTAHCLES